MAPIGRHLRRGRYIDAITGRRGSTEFIFLGPAEATLPRSVFPSTASSPFVTRPSLDGTPRWTVSGEIPFGGGPSERCRHFG